MILSAGASGVPVPGKRENMQMRRCFEADWVAVVGVVEAVAVHVVAVSAERVSCWDAMTVFGS